VNPHYSPHQQSKDPNELTASINMCFENKVLFSAKKTKQYIQNPLPNIEFYTFSPSILCERSAHSQYSFGFVSSTMQNFELILIFRMTRHFASFLVFLE